MKKMLLRGLAVGLMVAGIAGSAQAGLTVSGTVDAGNGVYSGKKLIYDADLDITWLDYTHDAMDWTSQMAWASGLTVTVNGVTYDDWRLPSAGSNPVVDFNQTTSEMGHLYYTELGLSGGYTVFTTEAQLNAKEFDNLLPVYYWSGTENQYATWEAWLFSMSSGGLGANPKWNYYSNNYGLAVRTGQVTAPVPEPASMLLLGTGLTVVLVAARRKKARR
jgi:hypothetical protein